jgi:pimeloyl-ACP methyl ester carboxylesterase
MSWYRDRRQQAAAGPRRQPAGGTFTERYAAARRPSLARRLLHLGWLVDLATLTLALALVAALAYGAWLAVAWSGRLVEPRQIAAVGPTPKELGWAVQDVRMTTEDGVLLRGWYLTAASRSDRTIVLAHDWGSERSRLLEPYAGFLRARYNVLAFDFRGHGQSERSETTLGLHERRDLAAALAEAGRRGARRIGVLGVGMGGATALGLESDDRRFRAVVADSPYVRTADFVAARLEGEGLPAAWPGNWAVLLGMLFRTGSDITAGDALGGRTEASRPTLVVAGAEDPLLPEDTLDELRRGHASLTVWTVAGAAHAEPRRLAGSQYAERVLTFFDRQLGSP